MGNISGVAVAIHTGGPGALFWMWISAILGMSTKFFTCTLSIMYRGKDENGEVQGGPMYVIKEGLPEKLHFLAYVFSIAGLFGCFSLFQANQLTEIINTQIFVHFDFFKANPLYGKIFVGCFLQKCLLVWTRGACRPLGRGFPDLSVSEICEEQMCLSDALELARACGYFCSRNQKSDENFGSRKSTPQVG